MKAILLAHSPQSSSTTKVTQRTESWKVKESETLFFFALFASFVVKFEWDWPRCVSELRLIQRSPADLVG